MVEQMKSISSSDPSQDSGQGDDLVTEGSDEGDSHYSELSSAPTSPSVESYYSLSSKEWSGSEAVDGVAKKDSENLQTEEDELELYPAVTEGAFLPKDESAAKSDELAESERRYSKTAEESAIGLTEEGNQVTEVATEVPEGILLGDRENAAEARGLDGVVKHGGNGSQIAGGDETSPETKVQHGSPLVVHRSKWWNCCGLLDFVTNPDG